MRLEVGQKYLLETVNTFGKINPKSEWLVATWDGNHLIDSNSPDLFWDEWLNDLPKIHDLVEDSVFKMKFNGLKVTCRIQRCAEPIKNTSLQALRVRTEDRSMSEVPWRMATTVGQQVADYPDRVFVEIISPFIGKAAN